MATVSAEVPRTRTAGFIERHGLWNAEQIEAADAVRAQVAEHELRQVRLCWGDQHGIVRGKSLLIDEFMASLVGGKDFQSVTLALDTANHPAVPIFESGMGFGIAELTGQPDVVLVPDPTTFRVLPWSPDTGWLLSDMYFQDGSPVPFCTRRVMRQSLEKLREAGFEYMAGLEVEFYLTRLLDPSLAPEQCGMPPEPPKVEAVAHGFQYLTESRNDEIDPILRVLERNLTGLGLPLATMEDEWGPGQCEFTFAPKTGLEPADNMLLFRTALKQLARRNGYHATFMTKPVFESFYSSGWHLHQSLVSLDRGDNVFARTGPDGDLPEEVRHFMGGLLEHASAACAFACPTVNGYKRIRPDSLAPTKAGWSAENRGAMVRRIGQPGEPSMHLENRVGEPCANPYLYMASQIVAGLDGMARRSDPGAPDDEPYKADRPLLPQSLMEAVAALESDTLYRREFGDSFVDYFLKLKRSEIGRFLLHVTDWEHREYFEVF